MSAPPAIRSAAAWLAVTPGAARVPARIADARFDWPARHRQLVAVVPAGTPAAIVTRLHAETVKALEHPDMKSYMTREGAESVGSSPAEASKFFLREVEKFAKVVKAAQIKPD